ncbi:NYN domain-containing protein, partial [Patescibacteria group bacterium]|nr:NYN domain-containing protein [Patescibacteria group bacterium]
SLEKYDTFCLLSSDADFAALAEFLKRRGKKFILISAGYVSHWLKDKADLNINAQRIKREIAVIKQKPRL